MTTNKTGRRLINSSGRGRWALAWLAVRVAMMITAGVNLAGAAEGTRGGRVGWARLETGRSGWAMHSDRDAPLAAFIHAQTTLNIDATWYSAKPSDLKELCTYPLIYAKDLTPITRTQEIENLREYLRRGGFLLIDPCAATSRDIPSYVRDHREFFARLFPESEMLRLAPDHPVFRCYFDVSVEDVHTRDMAALGAATPAQMTVYAVYDGGRMVALFCGDGLECGWPQTPLRTPGCMQMIVNMYVYAMTRASDVEPSRSGAAPTQAKRAPPARKP